MELSDSVLFLSQNIPSQFIYIIMNISMSY